MYGAITEGETESRGAKRRRNFGISFIHSFIYFLRAKGMIYVFTDMLILETAYSLQRSCIHAAWTGFMTINKVIDVCNLLLWLVI